MKTKNKRIPLSIIRLHKMAQYFTMKDGERKNELLRKENSAFMIRFLEYINNHKNDTL
jgi:hypothetical protein